MPKREDAILYYYRPYALPEERMLAVTVKRTPDEPHIYYMNHGAKRSGRLEGFMKDGYFLTPEEAVDWSIEKLSRLAIREIDALCEATVFRENNENIKPL